PAAVAAPAGSTAPRTAAGSGGHFLPCRFAGVRWRPCGPAAAAGRDGGYRLGGCGGVSGRLRGNPGSTRPTVHLQRLSGCGYGYRTAGLAEWAVRSGGGISAVISTGDRGDAVLGSIATAPARQVGAGGGECGGGGTSAGGAGSGDVGHRHSRAGGVRSCAGGGGSPG